MRQTEFSKRLHVALDLGGVSAGRRRNTELADIYGVSRETARKWLSGVALPELDRMIDIAMRFGVSMEWLSTGRGSPRVESSVREPHASYVADRDEAKLLGVIRMMPKTKRAALLELLT